MTQNSGSDRPKRTFADALFENQYPETALPHIRRELERSNEIAEQQRRALEAQTAQGASNDARRQAREAGAQWVSKLPSLTEAVERQIAAGSLVAALKLYREIPVPHRALKFETIADAALYQSALDSYSRLEQKLRESGDHDVVELTKRFEELAVEVPALESRASGLATAALAARYPAHLYPWFGCYKSRRSLRDVLHEIGREHKWTTAIVVFVSAYIGSMFGPYTRTLVTLALASGVLASYLYRNWWHGRSESLEVSSIMRRDPGLAARVDHSFNGALVEVLKKSPMEGERVLDRIAKLSAEQSEIAALLGRY